MFSSKKNAAVLLAWCLWTPLAFASPSLSHLTSNSSTATNTVTITGVTIAANHLLVIGCGYRTGLATDVPAISDSNGASDVFIVRYNTASGSGVNSVVAYVKTIGLSAGTVTMSTTTSNAANVLACSAEDVTNFNTTTPEDVAAYNIGTGATSSAPAITSGTPSQAGDLMYSPTAFENATMTEDATWTSTTNNVGNSNGHGATAYKIGGAGTVSRTASLTASVIWRANLIAIAPATGAATACQRSRAGVGC